MAPVEAEPRASSSPAAEPLLAPDFLRRLERLRLATRRLFPGRMRGERRSTRRGASVEFADFRNYAQGDDLRYLDWNVYARLERLFIKLFVEEEDLHVYLLVDGSESMTFGSPAKFDYARRAAAALGYIALHSLDRVGFAVLGPRVRAIKAPARGRGAALDCFGWLQEQAAEGGTNLAASLREFALRTRRRGVAVLISDFLDPGYADGLRACSAASRSPRSRCWSPTRSSRPCGAICGWWTARPAPSARSASASRCSGDTGRRWPASAPISSPPARAMASPTCAHPPPTPSRTSCSTPCAGAGWSPRRRR
jgi:hypothetical protein